MTSKHLFRIIKNDSLSVLQLNSIFHIRVRETAFSRTTPVDVYKRQIKDPTATPDDQRTYYVPNSYIYFGVNGGTPIKWRVLNADTVSYTHLDVYKRQMHRLWCLYKRMPVWCHF